MIPVSYTHLYQTLKAVMKQQKGREEQCRKQGCWWKREEQLAKKQHHTCLLYTSMENPKYLDGTKREIVQFIYDVNPGGQAIQCSTMQVVNLTRLPIYLSLIHIWAILHFC